jgi:6-phosphogluconolactonase
MNQTIHIFKSVDELSQFFAEKLAANILKTPQGKFFSLVLSGGSTPKKVFEYLAANFSDKIDWQKVMIFWGDERCVTPESDESNYRMAKESLLDHIPVPNHHIFRIEGETEPVTESGRYSELVRQYFQKNNDFGFDFMMLGLGEDGHTVSVFPSNMSLLDSKKLYEVSKHPETNQIRITATGEVINQAKTVVFLATGSSKNEIVASVIMKKNGSEKMPASMIHPKNGELIWLLDEHAARGLDDNC